MSGRVPFLLSRKGAQVLGVICEKWRGDYQENNCMLYNVLDPPPPPFFFFFFLAGSFLLACLNIKVYFKSLYKPSLASLIIA